MVHRRVRARSRGVRLHRRRCVWTDTTSRAVGIAAVAHDPTPGGEPVTCLRLACGIAALIGLAACASDNPSPVPGGDIDRGRAAIEAVGCGACHVIGGIPDAHGLVAPPLTNVAQRSIIAGELPNTPENMMRWIQDPQA